MEKLIEFEQIRYEIMESMALITLNRPEKLNAWTVTMKDELIKAIQIADRSDEVRTIVMTGAGKAYCAGADLDPVEMERIRENPESSEKKRDTAGELTLAMFENKKPIIAAINGHAVGVGSTMTLAADIRILAENAKMGFIFNQRGMVPEGCSTWFLPRIVGMSKASEWMFSGRLIGSEEALKTGLVNRVVEPDKVVKTAMEIALDIAANTSAMSTAFTRAMLWQMMSSAHPMDAHRIESRCLNFMTKSADYREGIASFLEKRPADFTMTFEADKPSFYPWWTPPVF